MEDIIRTGTVLACAFFILGACSSNNGVTQADLDAVRSLAQDGKFMASEARDIALRAERKADQALANSNN